MTNHVIFAIDDNTDFRAVTKFMRHLDAARALSYLKGAVTECVGYWEGEMETSYIMTEKDYLEFVVPEGVQDRFVGRQACVLVVPSDVRQPCHTATPTLDFIESVGPMVEVSKDQALKMEAWTFNKTTQRYHACV